MSHGILSTNEVARLLGVSRPLVIQWIDSGKLKGFRLPGSATRRVTREAVEVFARANGIPLADAAEHRTLLVVDDDPPFLEALRVGLARPGIPWEARFASTGFEAGRLMTSLRPDAVLLDIRLPDIDGRAIAQSVRQDPLLRDMLIVAMSGYLAEPEERRLYAQGFDGFIRKPFTVQTLLEQLQRLGTSRDTGVLAAR